MDRQILAWPHCLGLLFILLVINFVSSFYCFAQAPCTLIVDSSLSLDQQFKTKSHQNGFRQLTKKSVDLSTAGILTTLSDKTQFILERKSAQKLVIHGTGTTNFGERLVFTIPIMEPLDQNLDSCAHYQSAIQSELERRKLLNTPVALVKSRNERRYLLDRTPSWGEAWIHLEALGFQRKGMTYPLVRMTAAYSRILWKARERTKGVTNFKNYLVIVRRTLMDFGFQLACESETHVPNTFYDLKNHGCTSCQAQTAAFISLHQDLMKAHGTTWPENWHLGVELFVGHIRPVAFNRATNKLIDLVYNIESDLPPFQTIYQPESLIRWGLDLHQQDIHSHELNWLEKLRTLTGLHMPLRTEIWNQEQIDQLRQLNPRKLTAQIFNFPISLTPYELPTADPTTKIVPSPLPRSDVDTFIPESDLKKDSSGTPTSESNTDGDDSSLLSLLKGMNSGWDLLHSFAQFWSGGPKLVNIRRTCSRGELTVLANHPEYFDTEEHATYTQFCQIELPPLSTISLGVRIQRDKYNAINAYEIFDNDYFSERNFEVDSDRSDDFQKLPLCELKQSIDQEKPFMLNDLTADLVDFTHDHCIISMKPSVYEKVIVQPNYASKWQQIAEILYDQYPQLLLQSYNGFVEQLENLHSPSAIFKAFAKFDGLLDLYNFDTLAEKMAFPELPQIGIIANEESPLLAQPFLQDQFLEIYKALISAHFSFTSNLKNAVLQIDDSGDLATILTGIKRWEDLGNIMQKLDYEAYVTTDEVILSELNDFFDQKLASLGTQRPYLFTELRKIGSHLVDELAGQFFLNPYYLFTYDYQPISEPEEQYISQPRIIPQPKDVLPPLINMPDNMSISPSVCSNQSSREIISAELIVNGKSVGFQHVECPETAAEPSPDAQADRIHWQEIGVQPKKILREPINISYELYDFFVTARPLSKQSPEIIFWAEGITSGYLEKIASDTSKKDIIRFITEIYEDLNDAFFYLGLQNFDFSWRHYQSCYESTLPLVGFEEINLFCVLDQWNQIRGSKTDFSSIPDWMGTNPRLLGVRHRIFEIQKEHGTFDSVIENIEGNVTQKTVTISGDLLALDSSGYGSNSRIPKIDPIKFLEDEWNSGQVSYRDFNDLRSSFWHQRYFDFYSRWLWDFHQRIKASFMTNSTVAKLYSDCEASGYRQPNLGECTVPFANYFLFSSIDERISQLLEDTVTDTDKKILESEEMNPRQTFRHRVFYMPSFGLYDDLPEEDRLYLKKMEGIKLNKSWSGVQREWEVYIVTLNQIIRN